MKFRDRTRQQRRRDGWGLHDPFKPGSPEYSERAQQTEMGVVGSSGIKRVDIGTPVPRLPGEPQPVLRDKPAVRPAAPPVPPASAPAAPKREPKEPDAKPGLGKHRRPGA